MTEQATDQARTSLDQPPPIPNAEVPVWDLVIADMQERDRVGRARYGTPLQAHNGRDAISDAYAEALDLTVYLRQAIVERGAAASATAATDVEEVNHLRKENARLQALVEGRFKDARLLSMAPDGKGAFVMDIRTGLSGILAENMLAILQGEGAPNFVEVEVTHLDAGPLTFSVARRLGRSCAAQLADAKVKLAAFGELLEKAQAASDYHRSGYDLDAGGFSANRMLALMDELGIAVDTCAATGTEPAHG
jgi:hypothetical protein